MNRLTIDGCKYNNSDRAISAIGAGVAFLNDPADDGPYNREKFVDAVLAGNVTGEYTTYSPAGWDEFCMSELASAEAGIAEVMATGIDWDNSYPLFSVDRGLPVFVGRVDASSTQEYEIDDDGTYAVCVDGVVQEYRAQLEVECERRPLAAGEDTGAWALNREAEAYNNVASIYACCRDIIGKYLNNKLQTGELACAIDFISL